jgi:hypothetical protein
MRANETGGRGNSATIRRLTRGQAFALAGYLALHLREHRRWCEDGGFHFDLPGTADVVAVYAETLDYLLWTGMPDDLEWPDSRAYDALREGLGDGVMSRLLFRLRAEAERGGGIHESPQGRSWACARILMELEEIVGR